VESALRATDPRLPFFEIHTLAEEVDATLWAERVLAWLSTAFAIVAAVLAAMGVYATLAYAIAQSKLEIGIRMALGAAPLELARLLSARPMLVASLGVAVGAAAFYAASPPVPKCSFWHFGHRSARRNRWRGLGSVHRAGHDDGCG
jgi:hypothetical protein